MGRVLSGTTQHTHNTHTAEEHRRATYYNLVLRNRTKRIRQKRKEDIEVKFDERGQSKTK